MSWNTIKDINLGCHGIPNRCLSFSGKRMRICARCFGATTGHILSFILFLTRHLPPLWVAFALLAIMLLDWSLQTYANIPSTNFRRVITGFGGGLGVGTIIWTFIGILGASLLKLSGGSMPF